MIKEEFSEYSEALFIFTEKFGKFGYENPDGTPVYASKKDGAYYIPKESTRELLTKL